MSSAAAGRKILAKNAVGPARKSRSPSTRAVAPKAPRALSSYREDTFAVAIKHWWRHRKNIRSGKSMDGFRTVIINALVAIGVDKNDIYPRPKEIGDKQPAAASHLPSYYRASKNWDLLICKHSLHRTKKNGTPGTPPPVLIAAIEFKSQLGSIGKNQNNRVEESVGSAQDFGRATAA